VVLGMCEQGCVITCMVDLVWDGSHQAARAATGPAGVSAARGAPRAGPGLRRPGDVG